MANDHSEVPHKIFTSDPIHFKSLVNNIVEVETVRGPSNLKGILYTVDPVSERLVIIKVSLLKSKLFASSSRFKGYYLLGSIDSFSWLN